jgi:hypothetical protein
MILEVCPQEDIPKFLEPSGYYALRMSGEKAVGYLDSDGRYFELVTRPDNVKVWKRERVFTSLHYKLRDTIFGELPIEGYTEFGPLIDVFNLSRQRVKQ